MKYFKASVTKQLTTDIYIEVPDDFNGVELLRSKYRDEIGRIAFDTTDDGDWDAYGLEHAVECNCAKEVSEEEANSFSVGILQV